MVTAMGDFMNMRSGLAYATVCLSIILVAGCYAKREVDLPETFPVSGKIVTSGRMPVGFQIRFTPDDPEKTAQGFIQDDGTFSLTTYYMGEKCEGVAAGNYRVMIIAPPTMGGGGAPFKLPKPIQITGETTDLAIPYGR